VNKVVREKTLHRPGGAATRFRGFVLLKIRSRQSIEPRDASMSIAAGKMRPDRMRSCSPLFR
jgi:hypothetical protein